MSFTQQQQEAFNSILRDRGFVRFEDLKYIFAKKKTSSRKTFYKYLNFPNSMEPYGELLEVERAWNKGNFSDDDFDKVVEEWSEKNTDGGSDIATLEWDDEEAEDATDYIKSLVPVINISKGHKDRLILLDTFKGDRPAVDIEPEVFLAMKKTDITALMANPLVKKVMTTFDPYTLKSLYVKETKTGSIKTWHVNYYVPPRWRYVDVEPAFEGTIKVLIDHLFPLPEEREYVLDWLHYAVAHRNETVLCLIGPRGTGKGILFKDVLSNLIGMDYMEIVNQEILTDKFNGAFKNRRFIFFDEVNVSGERELNKFKAFCNATIALEKKGVDSETVDNYASMGLSSNDKRDFRAEPQERRFSVPEVTDRSFLDLVPEEKVEDFCKRLAEPESKELAAFGNFLLQRKPKNSARKPLRGRYFFNLCRLSMPEWKTFIIDYFINNGEVGVAVPNSTLLKMFKKIHGENAPFSTKRGTVETFLGDYMHEGVCKIGHCIDSWDDQRRRDTFAIMPSELFLKKFSKKYQVPVTADEALDSL